METQQLHLEIMDTYYLFIYLFFLNYHVEIMDMYYWI